MRFRMLPFPDSRMIPAVGCEELTCSSVINHGGDRYTLRGQ
jgi:hypothetical protein